MATEATTEINFWSWIVEIAQIALQEKKKKVQSPVSSFVVVIIKFLLFLQPIATMTMNT